MHLYSMFKELTQKTTEDGTVTVLEIPGHPQIFLGMNSDGDALVLFVDPGDSRPSRKLDSITIDYGRVYSIVKNGTVSNDKYSSIRLVRREFQLLESFSLIVDALVQNLPSKPDSIGIRSIIDDFVKLFERKNGGLRDRVKGLFGELLMIREAPESGKWIDAWHLDNNANKDFSFTDFYVEVKTSESKNRTHRIGVDQLSSTNKSVIVASVGILEDSVGETVFDLLNELLSTSLSLDHQAKLVKVFYETLGSEAADAKEFVFGPSELKPQIILFNAEDLPRPQLPVNDYSDAVSDISFSICVEKLIDAGLSPHGNELII